MEHTKVFEVEVNDTVYYVSGSAKHKLLADLHNCQIQHTKVSETKRKYCKTGTTIFFDKTLETPLTIYELISIIDHETSNLT